MKSPEDRNKELVAQNAELEKKIEIHSNVENTYKLKVEDIKRELATIEETKEQKLGELSAVQVDLENAIKSATKEKETALASARALADTVVALEGKEKHLKKEIETIETRIAEARTLLTTESQALEVVMAEHQAFKDHAASEKARILGELKELDDTAKAQVVVIQSQTELQTTLDTAISTKRGELTALEESIETAKTNATEANTACDAAQNRLKTETEAINAEISALEAKKEEAKAKATAELAKVEEELEAKSKLAVSWVAREEELNQREQFIRDRYAKAGINW